MEIYIEQTLDGTELEQYATDLRNPFALNISLEGKLICIDQGYDARGSRPITMKTGRFHEFLRSSNEKIRSIDVKFNSNGDSLYILDYGRIDVNQAGITTYSESGGLWKITKRKY